MKQIIYVRNTHGCISVSVLGTDKTDTDSTEDADTDTGIADHTEILTLFSS
jgi:hypothetical protein